MHFNWQFKWTSNVDVRMVSRSRQWNSCESDNRIPLLCVVFVSVSGRHDWCADFLCAAQTVPNANVTLCIDRVHIWLRREQVEDEKKKKLRISIAHNLYVELNRKIRSGRASGVRTKFHLNGKLLNYSVKQIIVLIVSWIGGIKTWM